MASFWSRLAKTDEKKVARAQASQLMLASGLGTAHVGRRGLARAGAAAG